MTVPESRQGAAADRPDHRRDPADELPPLPTLAPLPVIRPMSPMPQPPWEMEGAATPDSSPAADPGRSAPPPPVGHPAAGSDRTAFMTAPRAAAAEQSDWRIAASAPQEAYRQPETFAQQEIYAQPETYRSPEMYPPEPYPAPQAEPYSPPPAQYRAPEHDAPYPAPAPTEQYTAAYPTPEPYTAAEPRAAANPHPAAPSYTPAPSYRQGPLYPQPSGRHGAVDGPPVAAAAGRHVLVIGGGEPLGSMIAERLVAAGHLLALADVAVPTDITPQHDRDGRPVVTAEPTVLECDRFDTDEVVRTVARAEVALGGLDALVILPAAKHSTVRLDADAATWSDEWSTALTAEVLAAACASHIAARSFLARRRAGRIILITDGREIDGARPGSAVRAALSQLGTDLSRELAPHGVGVSVVTKGGSGDFGLGQVADVVEALLATPVMSTVGAHIG